ncbi:hypothetical protein [Cyclobacterium marinum]|uniref:Spy/CpxP family protein refolding chaperone n=1 Tax=Cyclobacterium marinum TaxID=104 RepID=UPI0030DC7C09|tara:strand:+ start:14074 stop:14553 length:480 start_codon:yes stop_codon:yes gene_type:complete
MSNKVYKIGFISLLVLNILLTLVIWRGAKPPFEGGGNANFKNRISKNLELTDEQEKIYFASAMVHQQEMSALQQDQRKLVKEYFDFLKLPEVSEQEKQEKLDAIAKTESRKAEITFKHFEELKELCNEEQQEAFGSIIKNLQQILLRGGGNNPPPPKDR